MSTDLLPKSILQLLKPQQVRDYAKAKGWQRVPDVNGEIALYNHPNGQWDQLIVPMDESIVDYANRVRDVVVNLAEFESRTVSEVLNDLIAPDSDIVRFRVASSSTSRGLIPLNDGIRLFEGARRGILSAACSVVNPVSHHLRMSLAEAQQLINHCQMGQTERKSFGISVLCPLRAVEQDQMLIQGADPFTRRAVMVLMRSLSRVVKSIERDEFDRIFASEDGEPPLSANLCDAVVQMQPQDENSHLDIQVSWAATLPQNSLSSNVTLVRIKQEYFPIFENVASRLRPMMAPAQSLFVGNVDKLGGDLGPDGRMQGEATLSVFHNEELQLVRVDLSSDDWQTAHEALGIHGLVKFRGVLHRGARIQRITNITEFTHVR